MIINAFKDKIFPLSHEEGLSEPLGRDGDEDEDEDRFSSQRESAPIPEFTDFEEKDETPRDIPDLEGEKSAAQGRKQEAKGLKILTPKNMLSRLSISLAQLKARNNSEKLINELRRLLYSLYRSKKLSKAIYKYLMNTII